MSRRGFGLRPRLLIALVLTAAVTLAVAALALLSPLESRLRKGDENSVLALVASAKSHFETIKRDANGNPQLGALRVQEQALRKSTDAQVTMFDQRLVQIDHTPGPDDDIPPDFSDVKKAISSDHENHSLVGDDLYVAVPIRIHGRLYGLALRRRLTYVASAVDTVQNAFLKAAVVGLLVAILLGVGFSSTLLRRLERLRDAARDMEVEGLDARPPLDSGRDEIGELTRAFASMHAQLRRQEDARRAFVATASHELRTPLASLDGLLELLHDDLDEDHLDLEDARERTSRAQEQARRLSALAGDLLDLSRLDAVVELRTEPLELRELCRAVAAEFDLRARGSDVRIDVRQPPRPCWVMGDPGSVARIIRILLDNALRVAPRGSTIDVTVTSGSVWAAATVTDEGPGVPTGERELIFERFHRGSATFGKSGFGLGLAIGRELAARMGGTLELFPQAAATAGGSAAIYGSTELPARAGRPARGQRADHGPRATTTDGGAGSQPGSPSGASRAAATALADARQAAHNPRAADDQSGAAAATTTSRASFTMRLPVSAVAADGGADS